ncbi:aspartyl/asparaginyl beta-hydroxylase [Methylobacterium sp. 174MFSha1.1]|uniref:aspartyl/asparaginyl beta-hydroxylase n=1 Tax=Methylobacterium sp. 174MFSha1.1 TaxID=1502749 RepID=UPI001160A1F9|nr:aspartyl/asparaginyl beta-hydroxylase [Methylobacterium sp. 174MFSha1.1]
MIGEVSPDAPLLQRFPQLPADRDLFWSNLARSRIRDYAPVGPILPLELVIFHVTRCGSTLVSRMLDCLGSCQIYNEPRVMLRLCGPIWHLAPSVMRQAALEGILAGLGQKLTIQATALVVKMALFQWLSLPLLETCRPGLPKLMIIRDPLEVLVSNILEPPHWAGTKGSPTAPLASGIALSTQAGLSEQEYVARCLGRAMAALADAIEGAPADWIIIDHAELPGAIHDRLLPRLGIVPTGAERAAMEAQARLYSKRRDDAAVYRPDTDRKQAAATPEMRALCARFMAGPHARLRALHTAQPG